LCCSLSISIAWPIGLRDFVAVARFAGARLLLAVLRAGVFFPAVLREAVFFAAVFFDAAFRDAVLREALVFAALFFAAPRPADRPVLPRAFDSSPPARPLVVVFLLEVSRVRVAFMASSPVGPQGALAPSTPR
jgi:hypothetical protein